MYISAFKMHQKLLENPKSIMLIDTRKENNQIQLNNPYQLKIQIQINSQLKCKIKSSYLNSINL